MSRCRCGAIEVVYSMTLDPYHYFGGAEIVETHSSERCGWGYECQDCWGTDSHHGGGMVMHFPSREAAEAALRRHLRFYCKPNIHAMTPNELQEAIRLRSAWEQIANQDRVEHELRR
jgi:hypothetical protein